MLDRCKPIMLEVRFHNVHHTQIDPDRDIDEMLRYA